MPSLLRFVRRIAALAALAAAPGLAAPAAAQTPVLLDFSEFRSTETVEYQATPGGEVTSQGFDLYASFGTGARNALGTWGTAQDPTLLPTNLGTRAAALWGTQFGERIDLETSDGRLFDMQSIDVAHMYDRAYLVSGDLSPITLFFYGFNALGANTAVQSFTIPAPAIVGGVQNPVLTTLTFNPTFRSMSGVAWFQQSGPFNAGVTGSAFSHQFTNIRASIVPEPGTYLLVAAGLGGAMLVARRRRAA